MLYGFMQQDAINAHAQWNVPEEVMGSFSHFADPQLQLN